LAKYVDVTERYINLYELTESTFDELHNLQLYLLNDVRVSIISIDGKLLYDSYVADKSQVDNHIDRPEIRKAMHQSHGRNVRRSATTGQEFVYYAKYFPDKYFIRMALPFDEETKVFFRANWHFIYLEMLVLFVFVLIILNFVAGRFGKSISQLRDFTRKVKDDDELPQNIQFSSDEIGEIGSELAEIFKQKIESKRDAEKNRLLKQQMTSNIAHELRTPVTSLRAYLETLTEQKVPSEQQAQFLERAYQQSIRLSELIDDVSLISKLEEASSQFSMEKINLLELTNEVKKDIGNKLAEKNIKLDISIESDVVVMGNRTLLHSVFQNLADNTIKYAGENIEIHINNYLEDDQYYYFSYYDTGRGVAEEHLNRIFERFYRIDNGRTRDAGGSGLGLSIVKNVILLHKGNIQAKIHPQGGLQFLFTLKK
jgi:signal transduction histidine kinase